MKRKTSSKNIIGALLGFVGAANSIVVGFYLLSTTSSLSAFNNEAFQSLIASAAIAVAFSTLTYGSYLLFRGGHLKGGKINIVGGLILAGVYVYYSAFSQPKLLEWLNPSGIPLLIPPILSGILGLINAT